MITFFEPGSVEGSWRTGENMGKAPYVELIKIADRNAIREWILAHNMNVSICANKEERPFPKPEPPKPITEQDEWLIKLKEHDLKKPKAIKNVSLTGSTLEDHPSLAGWEQGRESLMRNEPFKDWERRCHWAANNKEEVMVWWFFFETNEDATLFKLAWG